jgi:hypothetical protein
MMDGARGTLLKPLRFLANRRLIDAGRLGREILSRSQSRKGNLGPGLPGERETAEINLKARHFPIGIGCFTGWLVFEQLTCSPKLPSV